MNPSEQLSSYLDRRPQLLETGNDPRRHLHGGRCGCLSSRAQPGASAVREAAPEVSGAPRPQQEEQRRGQAAARQHGRMALDARRPEQRLHLEQPPRFHAARCQGRQGGARGAHRGGRDRQADADLHPQSQEDHLPAYLDRAGFDQGARAVAEPAARRRADVPMAARSAHQGRQARWIGTGSTGPGPISWTTT